MIIFESLENFGLQIVDFNARFIYKIVNLVPAPCSKPIPFPLFNAVAWAMNCKYIPLWEMRHALYFLYLWCKSFIDTLLFKFWNQSWCYSSKKEIWEEQLLQRNQTKLPKINLEEFDDLHFFVTVGNEDTCLQGHAADMWLQKNLSKISNHLILLLGF